MSVTERLKIIADENKLSLRKLSISLGKTPGYLSSSINKDTAIGSDVLANILVIYPKYNIEWVLTGEGEKLKKDVKHIDLLGEEGSDYKKTPIIHTLDSGIKVSDPLLNIRALIEIIKKELSSELIKIETNRDDITRLASNQGDLLMKVKELAEKMALKKSS